MNLESRLGQVREEAANYEPSPDLFSRVTVSIEEDRLHRRRIRQVLIFVAVLIVGFAWLTAATVRHSEAGVLVMPRWAMEMMETAVLVAVIFTLGPAIRRFGSWLVRDLFRRPEAAQRFLAVLDIAYYLVFVGVLLAGIRLVGLSHPAPVGLLLDEARSRIAVLLLTMGLLHSLTIVTLPLVGLIRNSAHWNRRHREVGTVGRSREAQLADRLVRVLFALVAGVLLLAMLVVVAATVIVGLT